MTRGDYIIIAVLVVALAVVSISAVFALGDL
jgi:hypothetical protein